MRMWQRTTGYFFPPSFTGTDEDRRQAVIIVSAILLTSLFSLNYAVLSAWAEFWPGLYVMVANVATYWALLLVLKGGRLTYRQGGYGYVLSGLGFVTVTSYLLGGFYGDVTIWLVAFPLAGALLLGRAGGFVTTAAALFCLMSLWYLEYWGVAVPNYLSSADYRLYFRLNVIAGLVLIILVISLVFANSTIRALRLVEEKNNLLRLQSDQLRQSLDDLKAAQAQLIQKEKLASLGELTVGIAHEIQNPLNFVNNFAEVSVELTDELIDSVRDGDTPLTTELSDALRENLQRVVQNGQRASNIVRNMLEHARTDSGPRQPTDLNALADEYLRLAYHGMRAQDKTFNVRLVTQFDPALGRVDCVPQDLGRVLLNLFNNAFYAVAEKKRQPPTGYEPTVWVSTERTGERVGICVRDNGMGIPGPIREKIFNPFFTTKPTGQGTGLGLSLSYDIVTHGHGGQLVVQTEEGKFAKFTVFLPINSYASA